MAELVDGIGLLATLDPERAGPLGELTDAALVIEDGRIAWIGASAGAPAADRRIDAGGRCAMPGFVDSHTHLVFAGDRSAEFEARMAGAPYRAGGIRTTVSATRAAGDDELDRGLRRLLDEALRSGTTTIEIKSGYGLSLDDELRLLRTAGRYTEETTFLGAHVVPEEFEGHREDYVDLVTGVMLDRCAPLSRWIDVFCDAGAFEEAVARRILLAGRAHGLGLRLHANQLTESGAVALGVELGAASVDHCTHLSDRDLDALAASDTVVTLVPAAELSTRQPFPDASRLIDAGIDVAIATDCNPGSSFTTSMPFCIALAVGAMGMSPSQAIIAATRNGAAGLRRDDIGVLRPGARADIVLLDAPNPAHLAYRPGVDLIHEVWRNGVRGTCWMPLH